VVKHIKTPQWKVGILIPKQIKCKSELEEVQFFKQSCPIEMNEVKSILYEVILGSLCSLMDEDFYNFCVSVNTIQKTKWKLTERLLYGEEILKIERELFKCGAKAVGMSSLGPGIFILSDKLSAIRNLYTEKNENLFLSEMNNKPRIIEND
jgi:beta-ribofuranosylaminobenzene 5'-phosphate synthase